MPSKIDKIPLGSEFFDKRVKLLPCQQERLVLLRSLGYSLRKLASIFSVDKRTVQFLLDPEKLKACKAARKRAGGSAQYYDKTENTASMRKHRQHKREVLTTKS